MPCCGKGRSDMRQRREDGPWSPSGVGEEECSHWHTEPSLWFLTRAWPGRVRVRPARLRRHRRRPAAALPLPRHRCAGAGPGARAGGLGANFGRSSTATFNPETNFSPDVAAAGGAVEGRPRGPDRAGGRGRRRPRNWRSGPRIWAPPDCPEPICGSFAPSSLFVGSTSISLRL